MNIAQILNDAGYKTVEGGENVRRMISECAGALGVPLCSGYRVFPDGSKCTGCSDCQEAAE